MLRRIGIRLLLFVATVLASGLLAATMVRIAPGAGVDERTLDPRLNAASIAALREQRAAERNILVFYRDYLVAAVQGDFGTSHLLGRPVRELIRDRLPVTAASVFYALVAAWTIALAVALLISRFHVAGVDWAATIASALLLCLPTGIVALFVLFAGGPARLALALVMFPLLFRYARNLLARCERLPHVLAARARGLKENRVLFFHVLPAAVPQLIALAGVSISTAFGSALAVEVFCDSPGLGQLAWQAALGRDLPVLVNVTLVVTVVTLAANLSSDILALITLKGQTA